MTEIENEKLLRDFFAENKQEIADNGFSRRVVHRLPVRSNRWSRFWNGLVMAVSALLFVGLGGIEATWNTLREVFTGMLAHGTAQLDPQSAIIAGVVLLCLAAKKMLAWS